MLPYIVFHKICISCIYILKNKETSTLEASLDVSLADYILLSPSRLHHCPKFLAFLYSFTKYMYVLKQHFALFGLF